MLEPQGGHRTGAWPDAEAETEAEAEAAAEAESEAAADAAADAAAVAEDAEATAAAAARLRLSMRGLGWEAALEHSAARARSDEITLPSSVSSVSRAAENDDEFSFDDFGDDPPVEDVRRTSAVTSLRAAAPPPTSALKPRKQPARKAERRPSQPPARVAAPPAKVAALPAKVALLPAKVAALPAKVAPLPAKVAALPTLPDLLERPPGPFSPLTPAVHSALAALQRAPRHERAAAPEPPVRAPAPEPRFGPLGGPAPRPPPRRESAGIDVRVGAAPGRSAAARRASLQRTLLQRLKSHDGVGAFDDDDFDGSDDAGDDADDSGDDGEDPSTDSDDDDDDDDDDDSASDGTDDDAEDASDASLASLDDGDGDDGEDGDSARSDGSAPAVRPELAAPLAQALAKPTRRRRDSVARTLSEEDYLQHAYANAALRLRTREARSNSHNISHLEDVYQVDVLVRCALRSLRHILGCDVATVLQWDSRSRSLLARWSTDPVRWEACHGAADTAAIKCFHMSEVENIKNFDKWCLKAEISRTTAMPMDRAADYHTRSALNVPLKLPTYAAGASRGERTRVFGVLQLLNKVDRVASGPDQAGIISTPKLAKKLGEKGGFKDAKYVQAAEAFSSTVAILLHRAAQMQHNGGTSAGEDASAQGDGRMRLLFGQAAVVVMKHAWFSDGLMPRLRYGSKVHGREFKAYRLEALEVNLNKMVGIVRFIVVAKRFLRHRRGRGNPWLAWSSAEDVPEQLRLVVRQRLALERLARGNKARTRRRRCSIIKQQQQADALDAAVAADIVKFADRLRNPGAAPWFDGYALDSGRRDLPVLPVEQRIGTAHVRREGGSNRWTPGRPRVRELRPVDGKTDFESASLATTARPEAPRRPDGSRRLVFDDGSRRLVFDDSTIESRPMWRAAVGPPPVLGASPPTQMRQLQQLQERLLRNTVSCDDDAYDPYLVEFAAVPPPQPSPFEARQLRATVPAPKATAASPLKERKTARLFEGDAQDLFQKYQNTMAAALELRRQDEASSRTGRRDDTRCAETGREEAIRGAESTWHANDFVHGCVLPPSLPKLPGSRRASLNRPGRDSSRFLW